MGQRRKPTALLELQGAFKKNPDRGRARKDEPEPSGPLGDPPAKFTESQAAAWRELEMIAPARVLTSADRWIVETACKLKAKERNEGLGVGEMSILMQCISRMGLTPSDRSKVSVTKEKKPSNPFSQIAEQVRPSQVI